MTFPDRIRLDRLRDAALSSRLRANEWREQLIEALGDHLCGCGTGPSSEDITTYAEMREAAEEAAEAFARMLIPVAMQGAQAQSGAGRVRSSSQ